MTFVFAVSEAPEVYGEKKKEIKMFFRLLDSLVQCKIRNLKCRWGKLFFLITSGDVLDGACIRFCVTWKSLF